MTVLDPSKFKPLSPEIAKQWIGDDEEPPAFFKHLRVARDRREAHANAISCADRYAGLRDGMRLASAVWVALLVGAALSFWAWSAGPLLLAAAPVGLAIVFTLGVTRSYRRHVRDMQAALDRFHAVDAEFRALDQQAADSVVEVEPTEPPPFIGESPPVVVEAGKPKELIA